MSFSPTQCDELWPRFPEDELVRQEGQAPSGGLVPDLVHHVFQRVDVSANVLHQTQQLHSSVGTHRQRQSGRGVPGTK